MYRKEMAEYVILSLIFGFFSCLINTDVYGWRNWIRVIITSFVLGTCAACLAAGLGYNQYLIWFSIVSVATFSLLIYKLIIKVFNIFINNPLDALNQFVGILRGKDGNGDR